MSNLDPTDPTSEAAAGLQNGNEEIVRLVRHRIIYDVSLAFYAVLAAFVLNEPLLALADSLVSSPAGHGVKDWTTRLLTLTLLVQAAIWFHALLASMNKADPQTLTNAQTAEEKRYAQSVVLFWSGVVMVVVLMTLGKAVSHGTSDFLWASFAYVGWSLFSSVLELLIGPASYRKDFLRHVSVRESWRKRRISAFNIYASAVFLVILALLVCWAQCAPVQGLQPFFQALIWLVLVIIWVVTEYRVFTDYYGA